MQLTSYISDLLYRYECVIIPGFGAFLTHHESAWIDIENNTFHPPYKRISFNRQLQTNDGLLANYIASAKKISYEEALQEVRSFVTKINFDLAGGKPVVFEDIGSFAIEAEEKVRFSPNKKENYDTGAFGLCEFVLPKVQREIALNQPDEENQPITLSASRKNSHPFLKYAAVAAVALLVGGFGGLKWYESDVHHQNMAAREKANSLVENQIQQATFVIDHPLPTLNLYITKQMGDFHLVAGAYKEAENADKKVEQLKEKGYTPHIISTRRGLHQVLYASFETRKEALEKLNQIRHSENPDVWLLVQKID